jgi:hypothetical protein
MPDVPFSQPAFDALETMAEAMDVPVTEAVRRALILLDATLQLNKDECLAVYSLCNGTTTHLKFAWQENALNDGADDA